MASFNIGLLCQILILLLAFCCAEQSDDVHVPAKVFKFPMRRFESDALRPKEQLSRKGRMMAKALREFERFSLSYNQENENNKNDVGEGQTEGTGLGAYHQEVFDFYDLEYMATVSIGTPPQEFEVVLDTGSANLWIPDSSCDYTQPCNMICKMFFLCSRMCDGFCCGEDTKVCTCDKKNKFASSRSTSYVKHGQPFSILYGTGFVDGFLGMDTVRFGAAKDTDALTVPNTFLGQATSMGKFFREVPIDGILGLAFKSIAVDGVAPPLMNAMAQGLLDKAMFTVYLETEGVNAVNKAGGMFTWGGLDTDNCGPVLGWAPLTHETYYEFELSGVAYGSKYRTNKKQSAISDTGTSLIVGPSGVVKAIVNAIGGMHWEKEDGLYTVPCDQHYEPVQLTIGGVQYSLPREVLSIDIGEADRPNTCLFGIVPNPSWIPWGPSWILGDPFIRQYCNIHDIGNKKMGFALAKQPHNKI